MICDTCKKLVVKKNGEKECAVLQTKRRGLSQPETLPVWGENCAAYTDDPDWEKKVKLAVARYQEGRRADAVLYV